jgi:signal peptidase
MATFLVSLGGPLPAFIYHMSLESYRWLSPILPKLDWTVAAFVGTITPALAMLIVRDTYFNGMGAEAEAADGVVEEEEEKTGMGVSPLLLFAGGLLVAVIWLNTGMLGVTPYLVSGPSMKPGLGPGDLVISKEVDVDTIEIGDIIRYSGANGYIIHRVVNIEDTPEGLVFTTKGDNNNTEDPPVEASRIDGKVILDVPYVGWLPIKIKDLVVD